MNPKLIALEARREILINAASAQRLALTQDIAPLRAPLALADQGLMAFRVVRRHPRWVLGAVVVLAVWRPRGLGKWMLGGWQAWRAVNWATGDKGAKSLP